MLRTRRTPSRSRTRKAPKAVATIHVGAAIDTVTLKLTAYGSTNVTGGATVQFTAAGGSGQGYAFSVPVDPSGGTVDAHTGLYTAGKNSGIDTVRVTDSAGAEATATVQVTNLPNDNAEVDGGSTVPGSSSSSGAAEQVVVGGGDGGCSVNTSKNAPSSFGTILLGIALALTGTRRQRR